MVAQETISLNSCSLCSTELSRFPIIDGELAFCCPGCKAVYQILSSQNCLNNFQEQPIFQQAIKIGLISNPDLLERIRKNRVDLPDQEWQKIHIEIQEMWCPSCAEIIRLILLQEKGVKNCVVDYSTDLASIEFSPRYLSKEKIFSLIRSFGYSPRTLEERNQKAVSFSLQLRFIIAAFCSLNIMMFAYPLYTHYFDGVKHAYSPHFAWISFIATLPVITYCAYPIYQRFLNSMRLGLFGMETLVVISVVSAFLLSIHSLFQGGTLVYFDSMSVIIAFVLLGKIIESKAKFTSKEALLRLSLSIPRRGRKRLQDQKELFVPVKEIAIGDEIVVLAGEKIVLDGTVIEGEGTCDESLMTGEAIPVRKRIHNTVIGGTLLLNGHLVYRVSHSPEETALQKIVEMVQQDIGHKSAYVRAADTVVRWFVPFVVIIALFVVFFGSLTSAIAVLLISCPCAIGIAAPLAEAEIINGLAELGAIVRNRAALMFLGKETLFVFDKTGTLTEGKFTVKEGLESLTSSDLKVLKGMAKLSNHLVCLAINQEIQTIPTSLDWVEEVAGKGMRASLSGSIYHLGSAQYLKELGIEVPEQKHSFTHIGFAKNKIYQTTIILGDTIKKEAKETIKTLGTKTALLTGDSEAAAELVAKECGIDVWHACFTPLMKRNYIEEKREQGGCIAMLGDGINDAAALTSANIGISVVSAADISIQVSDLLLTTDRLTVLPKLRQVARKGRRIIRQNLFWAFFYNVIGIGLAGFGFLTPLFSAAAMVVSSLMVILNAKRVNSGLEPAFLSEIEKGKKGR